MNGIVVAGALGMTNAPAQHYAGTIGGLVDGVSAAFRADPNAVVVPGGTGG